MTKFQRHIFVCMNQRGEGARRPSCGDRNAEEVRLRFKTEVSKRGLKGIVRANQAGCLNQCAFGVVVVVYPEQVWYGNVTVDDVEEIFERHIERGEIVERLLIDENLLNTPEATGVV